MKNQKFDLSRPRGVRKALRAENETVLPYLKNWHLQVRPSPYRLMEKFEAHVLTALIGIVVSTIIFYIHKGDINAPLAVLNWFIPMPFIFMANHSWNQLADFCRGVAWINKNRIKYPNDLNDQDMGQVLGPMAEMAKKIIELEEQMKIAKFFPRRLSRLVKEKKRLARKIQNEISLVEAFFPDLERLGRRSTMKVIFSMAKTN